MPRCHLDLTCLVCIQKLVLPPNLWLLGYLLFLIVSPWATFGYLLSYGRCSPRVAQALATSCSSLGNLLFASQRSSLLGFPYKICQNFSKSDVCLVFIWILLASFAFRNYFCHQTFGYWATYCLLLFLHGLPLATYCHVPDVAQG